MRPLRVGRIGLYAFLVLCAALFLLPAWIMVVTSLKSMAEIRQGHLFAFPAHPGFAAWAQAWSSACAGLDCGGISAGFWNSVRITVPSVIFSVMLGALTGYTLVFWRVPTGKLLLPTLTICAFMPAQIFLYPLVRDLAWLHLFDRLGGIVLIHTVFGLPITTSLFRNYFATVPPELFKAARIDGAGFLRIFTAVMLPMATPMLAVAAIIQTTGIWNDFLFGLVFAGPDNVPMTVHLNNIVNTTTGERFYNVNMAATLLAAAVPIIIYIASGRWFVRGIAAGAVKG